MLRVLSLADIQVEKDIDSGNRLEVKVVKDAFEQNMYEISVRVPESVENDIKTEILLKSKTPGSISIPLRINYNNNDRTVPISHENYERPEPIMQHKKEEKKEKNKSKPEIFNVEYEEAKPSSTPTKDDKSHSTFSSVMVLIILILFGLTMFDSGLTLVSFALIFYLF